MKIELCYNHNNYTYIRCFSNKEEMKYHFLSYCQQHYYIPKGFHNCKKENEITMFLSNGLQFVL